MVKQPVESQKICRVVKFIYKLNYHRRARRMPSVPAPKISHRARFLNYYYHCSSSGSVSPCDRKSVVRNAGGAKSGSSWFGERTSPGILRPIEEISAGNFRLSLSHFSMSFYGESARASPISLRLRV